MTKLEFVRPSAVIKSIMLLVAIITLAIIGSLCAVAQDQVRSGSDPILNNELPIERQGVTVDQRLGERVPTNLPLKDSTGREVKTGYYIDGEKPTIITLNYSDCPMLCNIQLNELVQSPSELDLQIGTDFRILTVSIDPKESTRRVAETKQKYLEALKNQPGAAEGWAFCTASQSVITRIADAVGFRYKYDARIGQYNHPAMLAYLSPEGVISRYSLNLNTPAQQLRLALIDAGEGTVGSPVDQFIFWCYSYDPQNNSYAPAARKLMKLGGVAMVGIMLACLTPYWIGRKRNGSSADDPNHLPMDALGATAKLDPGHPQ